mgnify:CR=1 FL=1
MHQFLSNKKKERKRGDMGREGRERGGGVGGGGGGGGGWGGSSFAAGSLHQAIISVHVHPICENS